MLSCNAQTLFEEENKYNLRGTKIGDKPGTKNRRQEPQGPPDNTKAKRPDREPTTARNGIQA
jgi:hypothetical protein